MADRTPGNGRRDRGRRRADSGCAGGGDPRGPGQVGFRCRLASASCAPPGPRRSRVPTPRTCCEGHPTLVGTAPSHLPRWAPRRSRRSARCSLVSSVRCSPNPGCHARQCGSGPTMIAQPARHDPPSVFTAGHGSCVSAELRHYRSPPGIVSPSVPSGSGGDRVGAVGLRRQRRWRRPPARAGRGEGAGISRTRRSEAAKLRDHRARWLSSRGRSPRW